MGPRQSCDAKRASRTARDASRHLVALVGLHRRRAVHEYALHAMLVVGSEAPCMTRARVYAALVGRVRVFRPPQRGRRKGTWRARARQDAFFKVPLERDQLTRRVALEAGSRSPAEQNTTYSGPARDGTGRQRRRLHTTSILKK